MSDDSTAPLGLLRSIVLGQFPWLAHVRKAAGGGLSLKTAASLLHLMGDAADPGVARIGDFVVRLAFFPGTVGVLPALIWYSLTPDPGPYTWAPLFVVAPTGPLPTDPGSVVTISTGSAKVTCA